MLFKLCSGETGLAIFLWLPELVVSPVLPPEDVGPFDLGEAGTSTSLMEGSCADDATAAAGR